MVYICSPLAVDVASSVAWKQPSSTGNALDVTIKSPSQVLAGVGVLVGDAAVGLADGTMPREVADGAKVVLTGEGEGPIVLVSEVEEAIWVVEVDEQPQVM